jgi:hypothetical protein
LDAKDGEYGFHSMLLSVKDKVKQVWISSKVGLQILKYEMPPFNSRGILMFSSGKNSE